MDRNERGNQLQMGIKAIFFDLGGVLLRTENRSIRQALGAEFGMTYDQIDAFVFDCESAKLATIGKMTEDEHWLDVTRRLNLPATEMPRLRDSFFEGDVLDLHLVNFLRQARKSMKTGLISNAWSGLRPWIYQAKFDDAFDNIVISAEAGWAKPDARIYEYAMASLGVTPTESIFVDDVQKNIDGANILGMHGILFKDTPSTLEEIKKLIA